jgi:hypothetical protein
MSNQNSRPPFVYKGFTVQPFKELAWVEHYRVTTPSGRVLSTVCHSKDEVQGLVYDYRNTDPKDRCEECSAPSKGPLMVRADVYHRVCHGCAAERYPQFWAFFRSHGWYPRTKWELEHNQLDQQSAEKLWDGSPRPKWVPGTKVAVGGAV